MWLMKTLINHHFCTFPAGNYPRCEAATPVEAVTATCTASWMSLAQSSLIGRVNPQRCWRLSNSLQDLARKGLPLELQQLHHYVHCLYHLAIVTIGGVLILMMMTTTMLMMLMLLLLLLLMMMMMMMMMMMTDRDDDDEDDDDDDDDDDDVPVLRAPSNPFVAWFGAKGIVSW